MSENPGILDPGTRYRWGNGSSGEFVRYELIGGLPIAIFTDYQPAIEAWNPLTEVVVGLAYLCDTTVEVDA